TLTNMGPSPEPNLTVLYSSHLPEGFRTYAAKIAKDSSSIFIVNWLVAKASQKNFAAQQTIVGEISGFVSEMVGNQKIVKAFQQEQAT
ncbi:pyruvate formate lyase family protein, partial [Enterococcus faecium]|uniref:pyruvate formate lyase family protein n=1 Tax=Enterococcus faecium TaxID=1352 RepID=UPI0039FC6480